VIDQFPCFVVWDKQKSTIKIQYRASLFFIDWSILD
jgi:hypothetical protein